MDLRVHHRTTYRYGSPVDLAQHVLHLSPPDTPHQRVLSHALRIDPPPASQFDHRDAFGNRRVHVALQSPHDTLTVDADSRVLTEPPGPLPATGPVADVPWELARDRLCYQAGAPHHEAAGFVFASPYVPRDDALAAFARGAISPGQPLLAAAQALMRAIHDGMSFDPSSTGVNTPVLEVLRLRRGVCQDFAHLMIGALRSLGLPARYVSGYLLTEPPPGQARLVGADASHAWVAVAVPDGAGGSVWFDFDPTNDRCGAGSPGEDYITLATGRDFGDVSPLRGVIQGGAQHTLSVAVTVAPTDAFPADAA